MFLSYGVCHFTLRFGFNGGSALGSGSFIILKLLALVMPLRVKQDIEQQGLDVPEHGEEAYGQEFEYTSGLSAEPLKGVKLP